MVRIARSFVEEMVAHAKDDLPNECCGILAGPEGEVARSFRYDQCRSQPRFASPWTLENWCGWTRGR